MYELPTEDYDKAITKLAADINEDGSVNISDVTILIDYLLSHN